MQDEPDGDTLHCEHNGWHPAVELVLERLVLLTGNDRAVYRQLVLDRTGARQHCEHLIGSLDATLTLLRDLEVDAMRAQFALDTTPRA